MTRKHERLEELRKVAGQWRKSVKRIGEILNELEEAGEPVLVIREAILRKEFGMSMPMSAVAMRWAAGELGTDQQAELLIGKTPLSTLAEISRKAIGHVVQGKHRIQSRDEGRIAVKTFRQMSNREVRDNLDRTGFRPIEERLERMPTFRSCKALSVERPERGGGVTFLTGGAQPIRVSVSEALMHRALELLVQEVAA